MPEIQTSVTRRRALQVLALIGASGTAVANLFAQARKKVTPEILQSANNLIGQELSRERLEKITPALQRNFDQFQIVRDLEIDDRVEPAPIFIAKWR